MNCGEGEIRTLETLAGLTVFETAAFDHSATSPFAVSLFANCFQLPKRLVRSLKKWGVYSVIIPLV